MPFSAFQQAILIGKYQAVGVSRTLAEIGAWLSENGVEVMVERQTAQHGDLPGYAELSLAEVGLRAAAGDWVAVVVGGDGTMLGAARQLAPYGVPLMGINSGRHGVITDIAQPRLGQGLESLFGGGL